MNPDKLKERQTIIKATPLGARNIVSAGGRRALPKNNISLEDPVDRAFPNFFDFEQELSGMKSSSELFSEISKAETKEDIEENKKNMILEEYTANTEGIKEDKNLESFTPVIMEEVDHTSVNSFDFIQCEFIKQNGERCKRQAPKKHKFCSKHKNLTLI